MSSSERQVQPPPATATVRFGSPSLTALQTYPSHFNWLPSTELDHTALKQHNGKLVEWIQDITNVEVTPLTIVSQRFVLYLFESLLGIDGSDHKQVEQVIEDLKSEFSPKEYITFKYLLLVERAVVEGLKNGNGNEQKAVLDLMEDTFKEQSAALESNTAIATLCGLKGLMMGLLGRTGDRVECFRAATTLCPTSSSLHQYLFSSLRRVRREQDWRSCPTAEELESCVKGYKLLQYKTSSCLLRMATLFEDLTRVETKLPGYVGQLLDCPTTKTDLRERLVAYVEMALSLNPHSIALQCKYGDVLGGGTEQAKDYWDKLVKQYPENSEVLHKAGRFYSGRDTRLALQLLRRGLAANAANFPCLMEYLRLLSKDKRTRDEWNEVLEALDQHTPEFQKHECFSKKLSTTRGSVLYAMDMNEEAVQWWLKGWDPKENAGQDLLATLSSSGLFRQNRIKIDLGKVLTLLTEAEGSEELAKAVEETLRGKKQQVRQGAGAGDLNNNLGGGGGGEGRHSWRRESHFQAGGGVGRGGGRERDRGGGCWKQWQESQQHHGTEQQRGRQSSNSRGWKDDGGRPPVLDEGRNGYNQKQRGGRGSGWQNHNQQQQRLENNSRQQSATGPAEFLRRTLAGMGLGSLERERSEHVQMGGGGRGGGGGARDWQGHGQSRNRGGGDAARESSHQHNYWYYQSDQPDGGRH